MVLVGKKSITAVRGSSRDQSESSGARRAGTALLLADMGLQFCAVEMVSIGRMRGTTRHSDPSSVPTGTEGCVRVTESTNCVQTSSYRCVLQAACLLVSYETLARFVRASFFQLISAAQQ